MSYCCDSYCVCPALLNGANYSTVLMLKSSVSNCCDSYCVCPALLNGANYSSVLMLKSSLPNCCDSYCVCPALLNGANYSTVLMQGCKYILIIICWHDVHAYLIFYHVYYTRSFICILLMSFYKHSKPGVSSLIQTYFINRI